MKSRILVGSAALGWLGSSVGLAGAQEPPAPILPRSAAVASTTRGDVTTGRIAVDSLAISTGPKAVVKVDGTAAPGLKMTLDGSASSGGRVWYRWFQTQGPRVSLVGSDQSVAHFAVPDEDAVLGFVLVVGNGAGIDVRAVEVDPEDPAGGDDRPLAADAGPDQVAPVGRRVTLDGGKSEPKGKIRYRWVQASGPPASLHGSGGPACSFVPEAAGSYQFALLVVGETGLVSEAALVTVRAHSGQGDAADAPADRAAMALDEMARTALAAIPGGPRQAGDLARALDSVADRINSFRTSGDLLAELNRRLDAVVARDPRHRGEWAERFIKPWTARITDALHAAGADVVMVDGTPKPLTKPQRTLLAEQIRITAAGFRAGLTLR